MNTGLGISRVDGRIREEEEGEKRRGRGKRGGGSQAGRVNEADRLIKVCREQLWQEQGKPILCLIV